MKQCIPVIEEEYDGELRFSIIESVIGPQACVLKDVYKRQRFGDELYRCNQSPEGADWHGNQADADPRGRNTQSDGYRSGIYRVYGDTPFDERRYLSLIHI